MVHFIEEWGDKNSVEKYDLLCVFKSKCLSCYISFLRVYRINTLPASHYRDFGYGGRYLLIKYKQKICGWSIFNKCHKSMQCFYHARQVWRAISTATTCIHRNPIWVYEGMVEYWGAGVHNNLQHTINDEKLY